MNALLRTPPWAARVPRPPVHDRGRREGERPPPRRGREPPERHGSRREEPRLVRERSLRPGGRQRGGPRPRGRADEGDRGAPLRDRRGPHLPPVSIPG